MVGPVIEVLDELVVGRFYRVCTDTRVKRRIYQDYDSVPLYIRYPNTPLAEGTVIEIVDIIDRASAWGKVVVDGKPDNDVEYRVTRAILDDWPW